MLTFGPCSSLVSPLPLPRPFFYVVPCSVSHDNDGATHTQHDATQQSMRLPGTLPAWLGWLALALLSLVGRCSGGADSDDDDDSPAPLHQPEAGTAAGESVHQKHCWIFTHMNKSGGQTIKGMLSPWIERNNLSLGLYDSLEWKNGTETAREFLENKYTVTWGAYTEGLRPHGVRPHCKWFTVFRHPVSRLVSAYYFCHKRHKDPLCATGVLRVEEADLLTFARHWTNFGLRQFAIAFILPESVMNSRAGQLCPDCPGW